MKKYLTLFVVLVSLLGLLAGCSKTSGAGSAQAASTQTQAAAAPQKVDAMKASTTIRPGVPDIPAVPAKVLTDAQKQNLTTTHTDANGKTFVTVSITDDPGAMNPQAPGSSKPRQVVLEGIFECLFNIQGTGGPLKPIIADRYEEKDENTYRVYLKNYVYDSAGNHFTAKDYKFVIQEIGQKKYKVANLNYVSAINIIDDYTFDIVFNTKMWNFRVNALITYLYTQKAYEDSPDGMITTPVGTGPYKLTSWTTGSEMVFETYPGYWEKDPSKIVYNSYYNVDKIIYKIIKDSSQRVIALESKTIDSSTGISSTDLDKFISSDDYRVFNSLQDQVVSLFYNCSTSRDNGSPLNDVRVRQAISYAIDNQGVMDTVDNGYGELCYTAWCNLFPDYNPQWEKEDYYNYNKQKALDLLKDAGWAGKPMNLTIMFESNDRLASVAEVIQAYLGAVGINLTIFPCDGALFNTYKLDDTKADILMATTGSSTFGANSLVGNLDTTAANRNLCGLVDPVCWDKIVKMCENAYKDWNYAYDVHYYIKDNCYVYMLYAPINFTVSSPIVTKYVLNQKGQDSPNCCTYIWNK